MERMILCPHCSAFMLVEGIGLFGCPECRAVVSSHDYSPFYPAPRKAEPILPGESMGVR